MMERNPSDPVTLLVFGALRPHMDRQGLPYCLERRIPVDGLAARSIGLDLGLPPEEVEAVFINGIAGDPGRIVYPGDRLAFVPYGTPGPYRVLLGIAKKAHGSRPTAQGKAQGP